MITSDLAVSYIYLGAALSAENKHFCKNCILLIFLQPQYKESGVYTSRFKQCLSRALNLVKTHVVNILQNATQQVMPKKVDIVMMEKVLFRCGILRPTVEK